MVPKQALILCIAASLLLVPFQNAQAGVKNWVDDFADSDLVARATGVQVSGGVATLAFSFDGLSWRRRGVAVELGPPGAPDYLRVADPSVVVDAESLVMWYTGTNETGARVMRATSPNGLAWSKEGVALEIGSPTSCEDDSVSSPWVLQEGQSWLMWYVGASATCTGSRIFLATSTDGLTWNRIGPVLQPTLGYFDSAGADSPSVIKSGPNYMMWYGGHDGMTTRVLFAVSVDGANWTKDGTSAVPGWEPSVARLANGTFEMWYRGESAEILTTFSSNGGRWGDPALPISMGLPGGADEFAITSPMILYEGGSAFRMWYTGDDGFSQRILLATPITKGALESVSIFGNQLESWDLLEVSKTETPPETGIEFSIIDAVSGNALLSLAGHTERRLNLTGVDPQHYAALRILGRFWGNGTESPRLDDWSVTWLERDGTDISAIPIWWFGLGGIIAIVGSYFSWRVLRRGREDEPPAT